MSAVTVYDLSTADCFGQTFTCSPREAVIAAYAQSQGDYDTWDYESKYRHLIFVGKRSVCCGTFAALWEEAND